MHSKRIVVKFLSTTFWEDRWEVDEEVLRWLVKSTLFHFGSSGINRSNESLPDAFSSRKNRVWHVDKCQILF